MLAKLNRWAPVFSFADIASSARFLVVVVVVSDRVWLTATFQHYLLATVFS